MPKMSKKHNFLATYLSEKGIVHHSTCPHLPQQIGVAECKFRPLLDISWDFLFHMNVPKQFWSDVLTACHLINQMPSAILDGASSLSNLFMSSPAFTSSGLVDGNGNHSYQLSCPAKPLTVLLKSCPQSVNSFTENYSIVLLKSCPLSVKSLVMVITVFNEIFTFLFCSIKANYQIFFGGLMLVVSIPWRFSYQDLP